MGIDAHKLGIIINHLFKMGNMPAIIHRITAETAPDLVEDSTGRHFIKGKLNSLKGLTGPCQETILKKKSRFPGIGNLGAPMVPPSLKSRMCFHS